MIKCLFVLAMGFEKDKAIESIENQVDEILSNLVKIWLMPESTSTKHYETELRSKILVVIRKCKIKGNKLLKRKILYKILFDDPLLESNHELLKTYLVNCDEYKATKRECSSREQLKGA